MKQTCRSLCRTCSGPHAGVAGRRRRMSGSVCSVQCSGLKWREWWGWNRDGFGAGTASQPYRIFRLPYLCILLGLPGGRGGVGSYLVVNTYVGHIVVPGCNDTGNSCIHINHDCHRYEEGAHGREDDVAFVLVVAALPQVPASRLVPGKRAGNEQDTINYNKSRLMQEALNYSLPQCAGHKPGAIAT